MRVTRRLGAMENPVQSLTARYKIYPVAVVLGTGVGALSAAFLWAILTLKDFIWRQHGHSEKALLVFGVCAVGGVLVGLLNQTAERKRALAHDLDEALHDAAELAQNAPPSSLVIAGRALLGVVSLGFGGPLGPEAPILAAVTQLSARLAAVLRISRAQAVHLSMSGALGALFAAPLATVGIDDVQEDRQSALHRVKRMGPEIVAGATALVVFIKLLPSSGGHPFESATDIPPGLTMNLLWCAIAAVLAALVGRLSGYLVPVIRAFAISRLPGGALPIGIASGLVLGAGAVVTPLVLFSGHHETQSLLDGNYSTWALIGLAALKVLVVVVCLAGGWYGGQIFPLAFAGAATALAFGQVVHSPSTLALTGVGYVAANVVNLRKPLLVLIIFMLFFPPSAWLAMVLAAGIATALIPDGEPQSTH